MSDKMLCEHCDKIQVLSAFRYGAGMCIACEYRKEGKIPPKKYTCHGDKYLSEYDDNVCDPECLTCQYHDKRDDEIDRFLLRRCVTFLEEKTLDDFDIEDGFVVSLPLDSLDLGYLDDTLTGLWDDMKDQSEDESEYYEDTLNFKRTIMLAEKILKIIHDYHPEKNCNIDVQFNSSELAWLEDALDSYLQCELEDHEPQPYWSFIQDILRTILIYTINARKSECKECKYELMRDFEKKSPWKSKELVSH